MSANDTLGSIAAFTAAPLGACRSAVEQASGDACAAAEAKKETLWRMAMQEAEDYATARFFSSLAQSAVVAVASGRRPRDWAKQEAQTCLADGNVCARDAATALNGVAVIADRGAAVDENDLVCLAKMACLALNGEDDAVPNAAIACDFELLGTLTDAVLHRGRACVSFEQSEDTFVRMLERGLARALVRLRSEWQRDAGHCLGGNPWLDGTVLEVPIPVRGLDVQGNAVKSSKTEAELARVTGTAWKEPEEQLALRRAEARDAFADQYAVYTEMVSAAAVVFGETAAELFVVPCVNAFAVADREARKARANARRVAAATRAACLGSSAAAETRDRPIPPCVTRALGTHPDNERRTFLSYYFRSVEWPEEDAMAVMALADREQLGVAGIESVRASDPATASIVSEFKESANGRSVAHAMAARGESVKGKGGMRCVTVARKGLCPGCANPGMDIEDAVALATERCTRASNDARLASGAYPLRFAISSPTAFSRPLVRGVQPVKTAPPRDGSEPAPKRKAHAASREEKTGRAGPAPKLNAIMEDSDDD